MAGEWYSGAAYERRHLRSGLRGKAKKSAGKGITPAKYLPRVTKVFREEFYGGVEVRDRTLEFDKACLELLKSIRDIEVFDSFARDVKKPLYIVYHGGAEINR